MAPLRHLDTVEMLARIVRVACLRVSRSQHPARQPEFSPVRIEMAHDQAIVGFQEVSERKLLSTYLDGLGVYSSDMVHCVALTEE